MLVPLSLLAIGGLFLGLGGAMTAKMTVTSLGFEWDVYTQSSLFTFFSVIKGLGDVIFQNLSMFYAIGVAFSLSTKEKGWAAFSAAVAYLTMQITISILLKSKGLNATTTTVDALVSSGMERIKAVEMNSLFTVDQGYFTYRTGVFGGLVVGVLSHIVHMRYYNKKLPAALSFFSGTRMLPILALIVGGFVGGFFYFTWPVIGGYLALFGTLVQKSGLIGTFLFRYIWESITPFGLHQIILIPMRWTELGGTMTIDGQLVTGTVGIQLAQLASPEPGKLLVRSFMGGAPIINFAAYPAVALAMYQTAKPENKKVVASLLIPALISVIGFGITEPMFFTFLFAAPWLYFAVHAPLSALGEVAAEFCGVSVYQGNIKDWLPFLFRPEKLNLYPYLYLLPIFFLLYYVIFKFCIVKFNLMTPGRDNANEEIKLYTRKDYEAKLKGEDGQQTVPQASSGLDFAREIIENLGGKDNISEVDNCMSRLRVIIRDKNLVAADNIWRNQLKALGVVRQGNALQIIYGTKVQEISADVKEVMAE
jgi:PTS system maltose and glucose-specific IIC component